VLELGEPLLGRGDSGGGVDLALLAADLPPVLFVRIPSEAGRRAIYTTSLVESMKFAAA
jgi:hypothetical protein